MKLAHRFAILATAAALAAIPSIASAQVWTTWTSATPGVFNGTLFGTSVTFLGNWAGGSQLTGDCCSDFWAPNDPYTQGGHTAPDAGGNNGNIRIVDPTVATILFGDPITNLYLAFISVGQPGLAVTYTFNHPFTVVSNNDCPTPAFFGCGSYTTSGNSITGEEFSGTIQFSGTFSELDLSTDPAEDFHAITVGADTVTPEPATLTLFASGLIGMVGIARIRKRA